MQASRRIRFSSKLTQPKWSTRERRRAAWPARSRRPERRRTGAYDAVTTEPSSSQAPGASSTPTPPRRRAPASPSTASLARRSASRPSSTAAPTSHERASPRSGLTDARSLAARTPNWIGRIAPCRVGEQVVGHVPRAECRATMPRSLPRDPSRSRWSMLSFGVTVLPDPPWQRLVELMQLAEQNGFDYGWTYDSHVLWQEPYPLLTLAAMNTDGQARPERHQPGTREPTVTASAFATLQDVSDGRMIMGIGRGDSARRTSAGSRSRSPSSRQRCAMMRDLMNGRPVELERHRDPARVGAAGAAGDPALRRRLRAEGARGRRPGRRRRDHPARRPGDRRVDRGHGPARRRGGRPRPGRAQGDVCAPATSATTSPTARAGALVPGDGLEPRLST